MNTDVRNNLRTSFAELGETLKKEAETLLLRADVMMEYANGQREITSENVRILRQAASISEDKQLRQIQQAIDAQERRARQAANAHFVMRRLPPSRSGWRCCQGKGCHKDENEVKGLYTVRDKNASPVYYDGDKPVYDNKTVCSVECVRKTDLLGAATAPIDCPNPY